MPFKLKIYVGFIILLAIIFLIMPYNNAGSLDITGIIFFMAMSILTESLLIITPGNRTLSMGFVINMTAILLFPVPVVTWITSIGIMFRTFRNNGKRIHIFNYPMHKTLFNGANIVLATGIAGIAYRYLGGTVGEIDLYSLFIPTIACIVVYIAVNATIVSILMSLLNNQPFLKICYDNIIWVVRNYLAIAPIGILMAAAYKNYGVVGAVLFLGPLLLARYSFKLFIDMKNIYIETVRALSYAVEAKDKYTQGHSLRVSEYSIAIANRLNLSQRRIDNIRIAAILHDIGKIGVEEHILNKQGSLTNNEFDKIKQHPITGVKIIQEIDFLKDVAEIILSHHEKIDGSGYPYGKKGNEICLESCILSVADVYDALTSDRPYRAAMSTEKALEIIEQGKDTQFSSVVVDAFVKYINQCKELKGIAS